MQSRYLLLLSAGMILPIATRNVQASWLRYSIYLLLLMALLALGHTAWHICKHLARRSFLGCDITENGICYVELAVAKEGLRLLAYGRFSWDQAEQFATQYRSAWCRRPVYAACCGETLILREIDLQRLPERAPLQTLQYEIEFQYPWCDDTMLSTTASTIDMGQGAGVLHNVMVALLKKREVEDQLRRITDLELQPRVLEPRPCAIYRAAYDLLPTPQKCLLLEIGEGFICCSCFDNGLLTFSQRLSSDDFAYLVSELAALTSEPYRSLVFIDAMAEDCNFAPFYETLLLARLLAADVSIITGDMIFEHHFKDMAPAPDVKLPSVITALGLALWEVQHAV